jgi:hypothetical protein
MKHLKERTWYRVLLDLPVISTGPGDRQMLNCEWLGPPLGLATQYWSAGAVGVALERAATLQYLKFYLLFLHVHDTHNKNKILGYKYK